MKYLKLTLNYLFIKGKGKHFLIFALFALLPSAVFAYFFPISNFIGVFANYSTFNITNYGTLWLSIYSHTTWAFVAFICTLILFGFSYASISSIITRHFRVNDFSIPKFSNSINENFFPALTVVISLYILAILLHTIGCLFIFLWLALQNRILGLLLAGFCEIICLIGVAYWFSAFTLWLPIRSFNGLKMFKAMSTAYDKSRNFQAGVFISTLIPLIICSVLFAVAYMVNSIWYLSWLINTISYIFGVVVILTLSYVTFCEVEGVSREDLLQSPYKRR
jgi:hypothetical protein